MAAVIATDLVPLLTKETCGGDHIHTLSCLFLGKGRGEGDHGQIATAPSDQKGMGGSLFLEREGLVVKCIPAPFSSGEGMGVG